MKRIIEIVMIAALVSAVSSCCKNETQSSQKGALEVIKARTSIRAFTGEKLTEEQINTLLDAAMAAPTAMNVQPWRFVVLTDDAVKEGLYEHERNRKMAVDAGAVFVVCGETTFMRRPRGGDQDAAPVAMPNIFWYEDCSAATENLLLAATALDLGAVWLACYPSEENVARIREYLGLPENVTPLAVVPVGYPAENPEPKQKWDPDKVHYNKW